MFTRSRMMQAAGNAGGPVEIALTISGDTQNYNVYSNRGGTYEAGNSIITLTINSGIYVGSSSSGANALTIPTDFHADDQIFIINNGVIIGAGGSGGPGAGPSGAGGSNGAAGGPGGVAILASRAVTITNNGTVAGGGGGGGGASKRYVSGYFSYWVNGNGGGGGAGYGAGGGGAGGGSSYYGPATAGSAGSKTGGGAGGTAFSYSPAGGNGGGPGAGGSSGGGASGNSGGGGGAAGNYANGNSNITWAATGTRLGGVS